MVRPPPTHGGLRSMHSRLGLEYPVENGMGEFLSPQALKLIAEDYQQGLLDRLNEEVKGESCTLMFGWFWGAHVRMSLGAFCTRQAPLCNKNRLCRP